jgi:hypothetical protein
MQEGVEKSLPEMEAVEGRFFSRVGMMFLPDKK